MNIINWRVCRKDLPGVVDESVGAGVGVRVVVEGVGVEVVLVGVGTSVVVEQSYVQSTAGRSHGTSNLSMTCFKSLSRRVQWSTHDSSHGTPHLHGQSIVRSHFTTVAE